MAHILAVCTANICRSPVVEVLVRRKLADRGHDDWQVTSAGVLADGWAASEGSQRVVHERWGFDLSSHRSRRVSESLLTSAHLILGLEGAHVDYLLHHFPSQRPKIHRLAEMAGEPRDVADPYGGPAEGYDRMVSEVDDLLDRGLARIVELASV